MAWPGPGSVPTSWMRPREARVRNTPSTLTPRTAATWNRVTGCRYAITASVSRAARVSRLCWPARRNASTAVLVPGWVYSRQPPAIIRSTNPRPSRAYSPARSSGRPRTARRPTRPRAHARPAPEAGRCPRDRARPDPGAGRCPRNQAGPAPEAGRRPRVPRAVASRAGPRERRGSGSGRSCGLLDRHVDGVGQVAAGPSDRDVAERRRLVELDQRSLVQLQDGEQADDDLDGQSLAADEVLEAAGPALLEPAGEGGDRFGDRQPRRRDVGGRDLGRRGRDEGRGGQPGQLLGGDPDEQVGNDAPEEVLGPDPPGEVGRLLGQAGPEQAGDLLVRPVLEDPGEEEIPLLEDGLDLVGVGVRGRQQPGRLQLQEGGRDDQELGRHLQVELPHAADLGQVVLGDA